VPNLTRPHSKQHQDQHQNIRVQEYGAYQSFAPKEVRGVSHEYSLTVGLLPPQ
jgi:hypothetical protein